MNNLLNTYKNDYSNFIDSISNMNVYDQLGHEYYYLQNKLLEIENDMGIDFTLEKKSVKEFLTSKKNQININEIAKHAS